MTHTAGFGIDSGRRDHTFEPLPKSLPGIKNLVYPSYGGTAVRLGAPITQIGWSHCTSNVTIRQVTAPVPVATSKPNLPKWNNHSYVVALAYSLLAYLRGKAHDLKRSNFGIGARRRHCRRGGIQPSGSVCSRTRNYPARAAQFNSGPA